MEQISSKKVIKLCVIEDQEIYRELYKIILPSIAPVELLHVSDNENMQALTSMVSELCPDVLLLSIKRLDESIIEDLEQIRMDYPNIGIVLLLISYNTRDIELLRRLALKGEGGMALFLKQSLDQVEQLWRIILSVNQGHVILDPPLATFMFAGKSESPFLKQLTARELEILSLLSKGYTNASIAEALYIDIKTVEHHLNSTYSKLKADPEFNNKHLRVSAARLYLETTGEIYQREDSLVPVAASRS